MLPEEAEANPLDKWRDCGFNLYVPCKDEIYFTIYPHDESTFKHHIF
jgi:hypothetical protein